MAAQSLIDGQCDLALAGGVSIGFPQKVGYLYSEGMIFSPDGHCRPFDARAKGIRGASGAGIVVLKRLADALRDRDSIRAVIRGGATNNDGAGKIGFTAPSIDGQAEAIQMAHVRAGVDPGTITFIEAHGTGTPLGDPIEIAALSQVFRAGTARRGYCGIGSVKSNIGHLDVAAGVAGLIKTILSLQHRMLPASLNFQELNPEIDFSDSPFFVCNRLAEWKSDGTPRRAGVSSFGIGGTNAHVVLEEAPPRAPSVVGRSAQLLVLSARSEAALSTACENLAQHLQQHPEASIGDVAATLQFGRKRFDHRRTVVCHTAEGAIAGLRRRSAAQAASRTSPQRAPVVFLFSGQGSQYAGMGGELYRTDPTFREELDRCADGLTARLGTDIRPLILTRGAEGVESSIDQTRLAQPSLFAVEYALARTWMRWGVQPSAMLGHSIGAFAAACIAGVMSLEDGLTLVAERGRLMQLQPRGSMLAVPLARAELMPLLDRELSLAAVNAPRLCVVSGPTAAIEGFSTRLAGQGIECRPLHTSHAFHSAMMDPALAPFTAACDGIQMNAPQIPFVSDLTGTWVDPVEVTRPEYWARHLRSTIRFADGLLEIDKTPGVILLEVGPGKTLATLARQTLGASGGRRILSSLPHPAEPAPHYEVMLESLGQLWCAGVEIDWNGLHRGESPMRQSLPTYPFERKRYFVEPTHDAGRGPAPRPARAELSDWFLIPSWKRGRSSTDSGRVLPPSDGALWLIFRDTAGVGNAMAERLGAAGHQCATVEPGPEYAARAGHYAVRPGVQEDYDQVIADLAARNSPPARIVHLWSVTNTQCDPTPEEAKERGYTSLICLARALGRANIDAAVALSVVSNGIQRVLGEEPIQPDKALVLGPCRTLPHELPTVVCQSIDITLASDRDDLVRNLLYDAGPGAQAGLFAYRAGYRWSEAFESISLGRPDGSPSRLRPGGVYVITGGLGALGIVVARFLADTVGAKLVLTSRSGLPPRTEWVRALAEDRGDSPTARRIRAVQELEALGAEVLVVEADAGDRGAMERAATASRARFGTIHGVFHAAGMPGGTVLLLHSKEDAEAVLAPKVQGTRIADSVFAGPDLDFLILFSSIAALRGFVGSTDYTAANSFLDAYANTKAGSGRRPTVLSINWDSWSEVGMAVDFAFVRKDVGTEQASTDLLADSIGPKDGIEVLRRLLTTDLSQVAVIPRGQARLAELFAAKPLSLADHSGGITNQATPAISHYARPEMEQEFVAAETDTEKLVAGFWCDLLGLAQVGIDDNFFALGGHSLVAVSLLVRIERECQVRLPLRTIFEAPTVRELAQRVEAVVWATTSAASASVAGHEKILI